MAQSSTSSTDTTPALVAAARDGNTDLVKLLVEQGHALNATDRNGATSLYWACCRGHDSICELLLDAGCDTTVCVNWGATALLAAADNGQENCVRLLLRRNADVNIATDRGDTPLHVAAYRGHLNIIRLLEEAGADPFKKNSSSLTPVQEAHTKQQHQCVSNLLQYMESLGVPRFSSLPTMTNCANEPSASLDEPYGSWPVQRKIPSPPQMSRIPNDGELLSHPLAEKNVNNLSGTRSQTNPGIVTHRQLKESSSHALSVPRPRSNENINPAHSARSAEDKILNTPRMNVRLPTESAAIEEDNASSFESLSGKALQIPTRLGSPSLQGTNKRIPPPSRGDFNQENREAVLYRRGSEVEPSQHNPRLDHKDISMPPSLPPRSIRLRTDQGQLTQVSPALWEIRQKTNTGNIAPSEEVDHSRRARHSHREVMPGVRVGDFVEQLQLQMVELQEKLSYYETLNAQLRGQVQAQQEENIALRNENSRLLSLIHPRKTRNFQPRGQSELDSDVGQSPFQSCQSAFLSPSYQQFYTSESETSDTDNTGRSKQPVESSEFDTN